MTGIWVDTDFGFDDLWALLLLRHLNCAIAGVSLVAGNAPLAQVAANAAAAKRTYGFDWPVWQGASHPLKRAPETAARILGPTGMQSRGRYLDPSACVLPSVGALDAMIDWVQRTTCQSCQILALGPLTNIALLLQSFPDLSEKVSRLVWMGGSAGKGNHTAFAEFNALADAEALEEVIASGIRLDIVDLTFCRRVTFGPDDLPDTDPLTHDLLGGYLDIALTRGRSKMAIYDPVASLAIARPDTIKFQSCKIAVDTEAASTYGATKFALDQAAATRLSVGGVAGISQLCLNALQGGARRGQRL